MYVRVCLPVGSNLIRLADGGWRSTMDGVAGGDQVAGGIECESPHGKIRHGISGENVRASGV